MRFEDEHDWKKTGGRSRLRDKYWKFVMLLAQLFIISNNHKHTHLIVLANELSIAIGQIFISSRTSDAGRSCGVFAAIRALFMLENCS